MKSELAREEVLRQIAVSRGLTASDGDIRTVIRNDFRFFNPETNEYDETIYKEYRQSRSVQELERGFETTALINKLRWSVVLGADLPKERVREQYIDFATQVDIQYVRIDPNVIRKSIQVSDQEGLDWIAENGAKVKDRYGKDFSRLYDPERLTLDIIRLDKEDGPNEGTRATRCGTNACDAWYTIRATGAKVEEDDSALNGGRLSERRLPIDDPSKTDALAGIQEGGMTEIIETESSMFFTD